MKKSGLTKYGIIEQYLIMFIHIYVLVIMHVDNPRNLNEGEIFQGPALE